MVMFFTEPCYARQALANSLVRIKDKPVWIQDVGNDWSTTLYFPMDQSSVSVDDIRDVSDLNVEPVPLGYVNLSRSASYVRRVPRRRWKQGLNEDSFRTSNGRVGLRGMELCRCILNQYPSMSVALALLLQVPNCTSMAFHRNWAVQGGLVQPSLMYKGKNVGIIQDGVPKLKEEYEYLIESLEEISDVDFGKVV